MSRCILNFLFAGALAAANLASAPARAEDAALQAAVAGPQRTPANVARDSVRRPVEALTFWGLKPRQTVIEVGPGGGYWLEILAPYAKATGGRYIATTADLEDPKLSDTARSSRATLEAKYADQARYGPIAYSGFGLTSKPLGPDGSADLVLTARNVHNWLWTPGMVDKAMADFYAVLKPGGVLGIEEHRADPRPQIPDAKDGYVAVATVVAAAQKAGFKLDGQSEINANPKDTKDHPFGVWTLPPVRRTSPQGQPPNPAFDRTKYEAIGESDRMTLRFVRPG